MVVAAGWLGWRIHNGLGELLAAFGLVAAVRVRHDLGGAAGLVLRSPEAAQALGFILFPLTFVSNAFVPTQGMPAWLRHRRLEPDQRAGRRLPGAVRRPNPAATVQAWPMQHPELAA